MRKVFLFACLIFVAAMAPAQQSVLLRLKTKSGQVFKYTMKMQGSGPQAMNMAMQMNMKVAAVKNGQVTMNTTMGNITMNNRPLPPQAAAQLKKMLIVTVMDSRGRVLKTETKGVPGAPSGGGTEGSSVPFPEKAVRIGQSWTGDATIQGKKVKTSYKLVGFKTIAGKSAAVIHATPQDMPQMKLDGPIVFSVEIATGFPLSMSMSGSVGGGAQSQKMKMTMSRS
jgi:hypothetical protein